MKSLYDSWKSRELKIELIGDYLFQLKNDTSYRNYHLEIICSIINSFPLKSMVKYLNSLFSTIIMSFDTLDNTNLHFALQALLYCFRNINTDSILTFVTSKYFDMLTSKLSQSQKYLSQFFPLIMIICDTTITKKQNANVFKVLLSNIEIIMKSLESSNLEDVTKFIIQYLPLISKSFNGCVRDNGCLYFLYELICSKKLFSHLFQVFLRFFNINDVFYSEYYFDGIIAFQDDLGLAKRALILDLRLHENVLCTYLIGKIPIIDRMPQHLIDICIENTELYSIIMKIYRFYLPIPDLPHRLHGITNNNDKKDPLVNKITSFIQNQCIIHKGDLFSQPELLINMCILMHQGYEFDLPIEINYDNTDLYPYLIILIPHFDPFIKNENLEKLVYHYPPDDIAIWYKYNISDVVFRFGNEVFSKIYFKENTMIKKTNYLLESIKNENPKFQNEMKEEFERNSQAEIKDEGDPKNNENHERIEKWKCTKAPDFESNIFEAAAKGKLTSIIYLIANGTNVNERFPIFDKFDGWWMMDSTPLHFSARYGHLSVVEYLVYQKADINAKNANVEFLYLIGLLFI